MTNANINPDPFVQFISEQIDYFANESIRLQDESILVAHKELTDSFFSIEQKLGTVEHEVALDDLSNQYSKAGPEVAEAWREIWRRFNRQRKKASAFERKCGSHISDVKSGIRAFEESLLNHTSEDGEVTQLLRDALFAMKGATRSGKLISKKWWIFPWLFLWVDLHIYTAYVR